MANFPISDPTSIQPLTKANLAINILCVELMKRVDVQRHSLFESV